MQLIFVFLHRIDTSMSEEESRPIVIHELVAVANEFCWFVENIQRYDAGVIMEYMRKMIPLLYVKGSMLKAPENYDESFMQRYVTEETYEIIFNDIRNKLQQNDRFYVFNPELKEPEERSMAECLTDIYQDLKDGLIAFTKGIEPEKVCAEFYLHEWFITRWGAQAAVLMPVLHDEFQKNTLQPQSGTEFD